MEGKPEPLELRGLIFNSVCRIFEIIDDAPKNITYLVNISYIEIYNEEIRDLLVHKNDAAKKLDLKETKDGISLSASSILVKELKEVNKILAIGSKNRVKGETNMNKESSRSHYIFLITVEMMDDTKQEKNGKLKQGKLNMVDL